jgi:hypothetical protein
VDEKISRGAHRYPEEFREAICAELQIHMQKTNIDLVVENMHAEIGRVDASIYPAVESYKKFS